MNEKDMEVIGVIAKALNIKGHNLTLDSSPENVEDWDSLGHLGILVDLDKFFDGKVGGIKEMATADSVGRILQLLRDNSLLYS